MEELNSILSEMLMGSETTMNPKKIKMKVCNFLLFFYI
jgi:hypothetical protein